MLYNVTNGKFIGIMGWVVLPPSGYELDTARKRTPIKEMSWSQVEYFTITKIQKLPCLAVAERDEAPHLVKLGLR